MLIHIAHRHKSDNVLKPDGVVFLSFIWCWCMTCLLSFLQLSLHVLTQFSISF